jgi:O-antigen ligase
LALGVVLTRATMTESLRDALSVAPGSQPTAAAPGPGTSLVLDLLAWLPALLVLARAAFDRAYAIRLAWTHGLILALGGWAVLSAAWASDKFAAVVSGFHLLSAAVFLWAATQLVPSWRGLRVVAGVCVALLLLNAAQAMSYRYVELPDIKRDWEQRGQQHLRDRGLEPGSFAATSFEAKLLRGELMGFNTSPNSFAAVTVLLMVIAGGVVAQRVRNGDGAGWVLVPVAGIVLGFAIIRWADSKTAYATPMVAAMILGVLWLCGGWLARHARLAYLAGVACFVIGTLAVIGHGLRHGSLVIDSLTFRWRYWVGAARVIASHPILGVGWDNFGLHYLSARLPIAAEEVRDPHNLFVRFTAELGIVGGILAAAFMLRLWWDATRPRVPVPVPATTTTTTTVAARPVQALPAIGAVITVGLTLSVLATIDFSFIATGGDAGPAFVFLKLLERGAGAILVLVGMFATITRALPEAEVDDRPSPWVLYGVIVGLGVFLLHNLVDFSLFEPGPMFLFALLAGSALGVRQAADPDSAVAPSAGAGRQPRATLIAGAIASIAWLAAVGALVIPVLIAEGSASAAEEAFRTSRFEQAAQAYQDAASTVPYNGEYAFHAARILASGRDDATVDRARATFETAIRANPMSAAYFATRAEFESLRPQPDPARVRAGYDRSLAIDPGNVQTRLEYAGVLESLRLPAKARAEYEQALWYNDQLAPDEVERLPAGRVGEIKAKIAALQPAAGATLPTTIPVSAPATRPK